MAPRRGGPPAPLAKQPKARSSMPTDIEKMRERIVRLQDFLTAMERELDLLDKDKSAAAQAHRKHLQATTEGMRRDLAIAQNALDRATKSSGGA
jgi:hypothetical protein